MLAAWHRLKYPHIIVGALAASAPVDIYPGENKENAFYDAFIDVFSKYGSSSGSDDTMFSVTKDCGAELDAAFKLIPKTSYEILMEHFNVCRPISSDGQVSKLLFYLKGAAATLAMLDYPYAATFVTNMPANPVKVACKRLLGADNILHGMNAAINVFVNYTGQLPCLNISMEMVGGHGMRSLGTAAAKPSLGSIYRTWNYQACTQLILEPLTSDGNGMSPFLQLVLFSGNIITNIMWHNVGFYVENKDQIQEVEEVCQSRYPNT